MMRSQLYKDGKKCSILYVTVKNFALADRLVLCERQSLTTEGFTKMITDQSDSIHV
jgi:hypothetical protein